MSSFTAIKGFKDILPTESPIWRRIEDAARDVARRYDFQELRPPIAEKTEIFARGIGQATDIVEKEMYTFVDKGDEKITLRPEATAGMVRAVIEHNLAEGGRAARLFCLGPMFRYERPQKGRQRQFHQLDVEVFGDPGPEVDAELLAWLTTFLKEIGLGDLSINLNSLGCPNCRPAFRKLLVEFFSARKEGLCPDCRRRLDLNPLRIIDCKSESCRKVVEGAPKILEHLCGDCENHFETLKSLLDNLGLNYTVNPNLVRGLDYYTRTAFEVLSNDLGSQSAVAGGGRYDGLCKELGGADIPGIGFACGLERLVMLLKDKGGVEEPGPDYYLAVLDEAALTVAFRLAENLRSQGLRVAADWTPGSLKSRMKRADKSGAAKVIMLGADEMAKKEATVRDLTTKVQTAFDLAPFFIAAD
ncbi:histidine--tRNA ligase [Deltaproteobacteria bacterium OttesenSCG-928-K17]|nr:histidine--tRNA ligase [Deltaproteobacteria bacterium OttesenSCG-928-K17]